MNFKTMFMTLVVVIFAANSFAAPQFSEDRLPEFQKKIIESKNPREKFQNTIRLKIGFNENIVSFDQILKIAKENANELGFTDETYIDGYAIFIGLHWWNKKFSTEALKYAVQKNNVQQYLAIVNFPIAKTIFSDQERFDIIKKGLEGNFFAPNRAIKAIETFCEIGENLGKASEIKVTLQRLNRIYTPRLAKDKNNYELLVTHIRLALQTY